MVSSECYPPTVSLSDVRVTVTRSVRFVAMSVAYNTFYETLNYIILHFSLYFGVLETIRIKLYQKGAHTHSNGNRRSLKRQRRVISENFLRQSTFKWNWTRDENSINSVQPMDIHLCLTFTLRSVFCLFLLMPPLQPSLTDVRIKQFKNIKTFSNLIQCDVTNRKRK